MTDAECERDLVRCRDRAAPMALAALDQIRKRTKILELESEVEKVQRNLEAQQRAFRTHPEVEKFKLQFSPSTYGMLSRFKCLLLVGGTQQGKTSKGMSLWGPSQTLKVSCGNCGLGILPSLGTFDRAKHAAILFDEIRVDQVLQSRELFQSNQYVQTLGTSPCNPYAYSIWVYHTAMILCANTFDCQDPQLAAGDRNWLQGNLMVVRLPDTEKWFE